MDITGILIKDLNHMTTVAIYLVVVVHILVFVLAIVADYALRIRKKLNAVYDTIRYHRDQKGHDRCWVDDLRLYEMLPEGTEGLDTGLPEKKEFLRNCERFYDTRQVPPGCPYKKD